MEIPMNDAQPHLVDLEEQLSKCRVVISEYEKLFDRVEDRYLQKARRHVLKKTPVLGV